MSRFFPHAPYAEDQPLSHTLLYSHVLYRGFQSGAFLGITYSTAKSLLFRQRPLLNTALRTTGLISLNFTTLMIPAVYLQMRGRDEIEWRDRAWRLRENKGQMEVDDFSLAGTATGGLVAARRGMRGVRVVGGAGVGSLVGVVAYIGWRYGVHQGKWAGEVAAARI